MKLVREIWNCEFILGNNIYVALIRDVKSGKIYIVNKKKYLDGDLFRGKWIPEEEFNYLELKNIEDFDDLYWMECVYSIAEKFNFQFVGEELNIHLLRGDVDLFKD